MKLIQKPIQQKFMFLHLYLHLKHHAFPCYSKKCYFYYTSCYISMYYIFRISRFCWGSGQQPWFLSWWPWFVSLWPVLASIAVCVCSIVVLNISICIDRCSRPVLFKDVRLQLSHKPKCSVGRIIKVCCQLELGQYISFQAQILLTVIIKAFFTPGIVMYPSNTKYQTIPSVLV